MKLHLVGCPVPISSPSWKGDWTVNAVTELSVDDLFDSLPEALHEEICQLGDGHAGTYCGLVSVVLDDDEGRTVYVVADSEGWALLQQGRQLRARGPHILDSHHLSLAIAAEISTRIQIKNGGTT